MKVTPMLRASVLTAALAGSLAAAQAQPLQLQPPKPVTAKPAAARPIPLPPARPAGLGQIANPIGAGDTVTAGVLHFLLAGLSAAEAFRHGLAMGSASCIKILPAEYSEGDYQRLLPMTELVA